jgi:pimeloyl-ACP methyl ester carboxylesterase
MKAKRGRLQRSASVFLLFFLLPFSFCLSSGCGARRTPNLERIFAEARTRTGKRPIIVIPGILGSQLINKETKQVAWPSAFRISDNDLRLPISPDLPANRDDLVASKILDTVKLARLVPEVYIYHHLLVALQQYGGYAEGDWDHPATGGDRDTFYVFPYDWRRDNVETAREFVGRVEELKRKLNRPDLKFNIIAHSMGGLVARYAAMYGAGDLPADGVQPVPTWAGARDINKIFMFGTPNEGSADAFSTLLQGYSVTEGLRRRIRLLNKLSREDAITAPSIFQLLPHSQSARFLDENLQPLQVDLYDPEVWRRYGWSAIFDPKFRQRFAAGAGEIADAHSREGRLEALEAYLAVVLHRAKRFHEALDVPVTGDAPVPLFAFGGDCEETLAAPLILRDRKTERWLTLTEPREIKLETGKKVTKKEVTRVMYTPGDGRVTRRSLLAETLAEKQRVSPLFNTALPLVYAVFACDLHSELQNNKMLQDNALTALVSEAMK